MDDRPLLDAAEQDYDAFVTADQNLQYQLNLEDRRIRIVVLRAQRTSLPALAPLAPLVLAALAEMNPGDLRVISM